MSREQSPGDEEPVRAGDAEAPLPPLPEHRSERPLTVEEMDMAISLSMKRRSQKR
jgi:hypothetical protein